MMNNSTTRTHAFILGMHRSGTSYLARALNLCGLNLGPTLDFYDDEINPKFGNPRGHWENVNVIDLNNDILKLNGGDWDKIPEKITKVPHNFEERINQFRESFYSSSSLAYGFKDPRFTLTIEKWLPLFTNFVLIGIFRHPLKVAQSLQTRNDFEYEKSLALWKEYNEKLLTLLKKYNGFLIDFDWPTERLLEETKLIGAKIGLPQIELNEWFSTDHKHSDKSFSSSHTLSTEILKIYSNLKKMSEQNARNNYHVVTINDEEYKRIIRDLMITRNSIYDTNLTVTKAEIEKKTLALENNPIGLLVKIYFSRDDLQKSFVEVLDGNYVNLIKWAIQVCESQIACETDTKKALSKFYRWYKDNEDPLLAKKFEQVIYSLQNEINQNRNEIAQAKNEINQNRNEIAQAKNEINQNRNEIAQAKNEINQYQNELQIIKSAVSFKIIRFIGSKIDKLFGRSSLVRGIKPTISASKKIIKTEGVGSFFYYAKEKVKRGEFTVLPYHDDDVPVAMTSPEQKPIQLLFDYLPPEKINYFSKFKTSVVILSDFGIDNISIILDKIDSQKGIKELEIILIYSGKEDVSHLEKLNNLKIIQSNPKELINNKFKDIISLKFTGDYVFFLGSDSIPASDHFFYDVCTAFLQNPKTMAVITRIIPKSNSDLVSSFLSQSVCEVLSPIESTMTYGKDFREPNFESKVAIAQIADICICYRSDTLSNYNIGFGFNHLHIINTILKDGNTILYTFSNGVMYSQNKNASSYLQNEYTKFAFYNQTLKRDNEDFNKLGILNLQDFLNESIALYKAIGLVIDEFNKHRPLEIHLAFKILYEKLPLFLGSKSSSNYSDESIDKILDVWHKPRDANKGSNIFLFSEYLMLMKNFERYLKKTHSTTSYVGNEFFEALYKIFGVIVGRSLGIFVLYLRNQGLENDDLKTLEILTGGKK